MENEILGKGLGPACLEEVWGCSKACMSKLFPHHPHASLTRGSGVCAQISMEVALAQVPGV